MQTIDADVEARPEPLTAEQQALFDAHMAYVEARARKRAKKTRIPYEDHLQHGLMGLLESVRAWDEAWGVKFLVYAAKRIGGAMLDAERKGFGAAIRISPTTWEKLTPEERAAARPRRFIVTKSREDAREKWLPVDGSSVEERRYVSPIDDESLHLAINSLGGGAAEVVRLYHFAGLTLEAIGERLGYSPSRVCQIHKQAMRQLRAHPRVLACVGHIREQKEAVA